MELNMVVEERKETIEKGVELTIRSSDNLQRYDGYWMLRGTAHPDVDRLQVGDRLRVTIQKTLSSVPEVERTIEEAERGDLSVHHPRIAGVPA